MREGSVYILAGVSLSLWVGRGECVITAVNIRHKIPWVV
jgi:hypothetical protein